MANRKPSNWYDMSYEDQRRWEKSERERDDLEYEMERTKRDLEASQEAERRRARACREERERAREEAESMGEAIRETNEELSIALAFIKEKGLSEEYDDWASYRRTS